MRRKLDLEAGVENSGQKEAQENVLTEGFDSFRSIQRKENIFQLESKANQFYTNEEYQENKVIEKSYKKDIDSVPK
jgi:hypothetical protein